MCLRVRVGAPSVRRPGVHLCGLGGLASADSSSDAAVAAAEDRDGEESGNHAAHGDRDVLVVLEPTHNLLPRRAALAVSVVTLAAAGARGAVEEVLIPLRAERLSRILARQETARRAGPHLFAVIGAVLPHGPALLVSGCALSRRALEPIAAVGAVVLVLVLGTVGVLARTLLLRVAGSRAGTADGSRRRILALFGTAFFVGKITFGLPLELALGSITARVVLAASVSAAVALLTLLYDAVAALAARDGLDALVVSQTLRLDVALEARADVADGAR